MAYLVNREFDLGEMRPMKNDDGKIVEKYLPRKCSATSKIIGPKDHASVQLFIPDVDAHGRIIEGGEGIKLAISGYIRDKGRSDFEIEKILRAKGKYPISKAPKAE